MPQLDPYELSQIRVSERMNGHVPLSDIRAQVPHQVHWGQIYVHYKTLFPSGSTLDWQHRLDEQRHSE